MFPQVHSLIKTLPSGKEMDGRKVMAMETGTVREKGAGEMRSWSFLPHCIVDILSTAVLSDYSCLGDDS